MSQDKIPVNEIQSALKRSGYLLETRTESFLRENGYYVEANASYQDPDSGKARELDIYAMKGEKIGPDEFDFIFGVMLIECVNNPQPLAFFTKEPQTPFLHHEDVRIAGLPVKIPEKDQKNTWISLADYLALNDFHHYCKGKVATQYCSFMQKKSGQEKEWFATHEETQFDAIKKLCDSTDYYYDKHFRSWVYGGKERINLEFYYPVLIIQGELLEVSQTVQGVSITQVPHVNFRRSSVTSGDELNYQIDIIQESYLQAFSELINDELNKIAHLLRKKYKTIQDAIDLIVRDARKAKSKDALRKAMEF